MRCRLSSLEHIVHGGGEGSRRDLSHLATGEGNHNGLSHSRFNAVPLHPQPLVVHHLPRCVVLRTGGRVGVKKTSFQSNHMYAHDLLILSGVVSVPPAAGGTAP